METARETESRKYPSGLDFLTPDGYIICNIIGREYPITFLILPGAISSALNRVVYFENGFKLSNREQFTEDQSNIPAQGDSIGPQVPLSHLDRVYTRLQQCGAQAY
jgi:hypothetical protein